MEIDILLYSTVLFLHIVGALGFFGALVLEWAGLAQLRRVDTAGAVLSMLGVLRPLQRLYPASGTTLLLTGAYLTYSRWGMMAWIVASIVLLILLAASGAAITGKRLDAIERAASAEDGPISADLRSRIQDSVLVNAHLFRSGLGLGVVYIMTVKPSLVGVLTTIGVALLLALAAVPIVRRRAERASERATGLSPQETLSNT